ncbi:hypothetical protein V8C35DRAFT_22590 [Trichoderma chlorosporum]
MASVECGALLVPIDDPVRRRKLASVSYRDRREARAAVIKHNEKGKSGRAIGQTTNRLDVISLDKASLKKQHTITGVLDRQADNSQAGSTALQLRHPCVPVCGCTSWEMCENSIHDGGATQQVAVCPVLPRYETLWQLRRIRPRNCSVAVQYSMQRAAQVGERDKWATSGAPDPITASLALAVAATSMGRWRCEARLSGQLGGCACSVRSSGSASASGNDHLNSSAGSTPSG